MSDTTPEPTSTDDDLSDLAFEAIETVFSMFAEPIDPNVDLGGDIGAMLAALSAHSAGHIIGTKVNRTLFDGNLDAEQETTVAHVASSSMTMYMPLANKYTDTNQAAAFIEGIASGVAIEFAFHEFPELITPAFKAYLADRAESTGGH